VNFLRIESKHAQGILEPNGQREYPLQRLPQKYKKSLRKEVWDLSKNPAGVSVSFSSNTSKLLVKWSLKSHFKMHHMTDVGVSGIDLYHKEGNNWHFLSTGIPTELNNEQYLFKGLQKKVRHYKIHLPLYNIVTEFELGFDSNSTLDIIVDKNPPLIFYGTSITQGGCASRPGLAYTNIISRQLDRSCVNLGFSGNGHLEKSIAKILSKIDSAIFIIDCMWNVDKKLLVKNTIPFIKALRSNKDNVNCPILFYDQYVSNLKHLDKKFIKPIIEKNAILEKMLKSKIDKGFKNLYLIKQEGCINQDTEATVDGIHFNDLGFERYSKHLIDKLSKLKIIQLR